MPRCDCQWEHDKHCIRCVKQFLAYLKEQRGILRADILDRQAIELNNDGTIKSLRTRIKELEADPCRKCKRRPIKPTHGPCCTCQICGHNFDSCRCDIDDAEEQLASKDKRIAELEALKMPTTMIDSWREVKDEYEKQIASLVKAGDAMRILLRDECDCNAMTRTCRHFDAMLKWDKAKGGE